MIKRGKPLEEHLGDDIEDIHDCATPLMWVFEKRLWRNLRLTLDKRIIGKFSVSLVRHLCARDLLWRRFSRHWGGLEDSLQTHLQKEEL